MNVPQFLLGEYRTVRLKAKRFVKDVAAGRNPSELPMVETRATDGLLVISRHSAYIGSAHFQMFAPIAIGLELLLPDEMKLRLFDALVSSCWGTLCLLDQATGLLLLDESRRRALLKSVLKCWPMYVHEGNRFVPSLHGPTVLWGVPTMIQSQLCKMGVPVEEVQAPLENNDLFGLLSRHPKKLGWLLAEFGAESDNGRD
jgi:hypothetical protein